MTAGWAAVLRMGVTQGDAPAATPLAPLFGDVKDHARI